MSVGPGAHEPTFDVRIAYQAQRGGRASWNRRNASTSLICLYIT
jgi:hypothetical protein